MNTITKKFGTFALVGLAGTVAHYSVLYSMVEFAQVDVVSASGCGALIGMVVNYWLNYGLTFNSDQPHWWVFPKFLFVAGVGFILNMSLIALLVNRLGIYYLLAQLMVTGGVMVWTFLGNCWWTFRAEAHPSSTGLINVSPKHWIHLGPILVMAFMAIRFATLGAYPLIDQTESRYAEMARKMLETNNWVTPQIDYGVWFWGKPPLAVWLNSASFGIFGISEFSSRLSAWLLSFGIIYMIRHLMMVRGLKDQAWVAPCLLVSMVLFFVMSGSVAMDQSLSFATTMAMVAFWLAMHGKNSVYGYLFFVALAIGLLSKGPIAIVLTAVPISLWVLIRKQWHDTWTHIPWITGSILMLLLSVPWYLLAEYNTPGFLEYFLIGEHWKRFIEPGWQGDLYGSGRSHLRGTIWLYWLLAAMPWSPVFLAIVGFAFWKKQGVRLLHSVDGWRLYCLLWMLGPLLFFTLSANIIWTYVLPGLPGCALLLADWRRDCGLPWFSKEGWLVGGLASIVPVGFLGMIIAWQFFGPFDFVSTQAGLAQHYHQLREAGQNLYYLGEQPYSAQFYTQGHSKEILNIEVLQALLETQNLDYYACSQKNFFDMADSVKRRVEIVGKHGSMFLLRSLPQAGN